MKLPKFEYLYCFWSPNFARSAKFGRSDDWKRRLSEVRAQLSASAGHSVSVYALPMPVLYAAWSEKITHRVFRILHRKEMPDHSGKHEWFWILNVLAAVLLYFAAKMIGRDDASGWFIAAIIAPIPIDFAIWIIAFAAIQYIMIVGFIYAAFIFVF